MVFIFSGVVACEREDSGLKPEEPELPHKETNHPFLIVTKNMFPALREKASKEPWKSMKTDAINRSGAGSDNDAYHLQEYIGAAALAYILDEGNETTHANRVRDAILNKYSKVEIEESSDWGKVVKPMGSFFSAILALEILYDALSIEDIVAGENVIKEQIFKVKRTGSWVDARYGTHGTWDIYKGDMTEPNDAYYAGIMQQITPDGVSPVTNHYAWERVGGGNSRVSKAGFMDVLEFTGIDKRYYNNERIQKFYRWLFGSSINCSREMAIFGDMLPTQGIGNYMLHRRVVNFDMEAAGYVAWYLNGEKPIGHILTYIVPSQELPEPVVPSSKIYENGGAFFRDKDDKPEGMHAVLYNIKSQDEWHTHNEVNGLALSGLGNRLLVNGGRLGEPTRAASLNNTLTINGENHKSRLGGGIIDGFMTDGIDVATGKSGPALGSSVNHLRNLICIHTADGIPGYFVVFDEVAAKGGDKIQNYIHPANQTSVNELIPKTHYSANIDHYPTVNGIKLHFYYLPSPQQLNIEKSQSAVPDRYPGYPEHNRLESVYNADSQGEVNFTTILLPEKASGSQVNFTKLDAENINGCEIALKGNISDFICQSDDEVLTDAKDFSFKSDLLVARLAGKKVSSLFLKNGKLFSSKEISFESDNPVTVYCNENKGAIITTGAKVKLSSAGAQNIVFNPAVNQINSGNGFIEVELPAGTFYFN